MIPLVLWGVDRRLAGAEPKGPSSRSRWTELLWRAGTMLPWLLVIGLAIWAMSL
jgi:hypothetical protein